MKAARHTGIEVAIVGLAGAAALVPIAPVVVERWFSTGLYPAIQQSLTPLANRLPFALLDVLIGAALVAVVALLWQALRNARRSRQAGPVLRMLGHLVTAGALVYLVFLLLWGFNYRRVPMAERLLVERGMPAPDAVVKIA